MKNKDIAEILQISPATVSLALNNKEGVREETRRKVLELKNSALKQDLSKAACRNTQGDIGLLIYKKHGDIISETPFFVTLTEVLDQQAGKYSYGVQISYYNPYKDIHTYIDSLNQSGLKGFLILATEMGREDVKLLQQELKVPFVLIDAYFPGLKVDSILMDNTSGIMQIMEYAAECGHTKLGFIRSSITSPNFEARFHSYKILMEQYGFKYDPEYVYELPPLVDQACREMTQLLDQGGKLPTLLIAANDILAFGALNALKQAGIGVPRDVSIVGFDDMPTSQFLEPPLTSVQLNNQLIGQLAVKRLMERIEKPKSHGVAVQSFVEVNLIKRGSVLEPGTK